MNRLLTPRELSTLIALAQQTIYNRRATGGDLPPAIVLGRHVRFKASDVQQWMENHKENPGKRPCTPSTEGAQA